MLNRNPIVLIVDDVVQNIQIVAKILGQENYEIEASVNGHQAIEKAGSILPDLILLDIMMPDIDGFQVCQKLKNQEKTKGIPIIFVTSKNRPNDIKKGFEVGASDYLTKPIIASELVARVRVHIELKFQKEQLEKKSIERKELVHILCHDLLNPLGGIYDRFKLIENYDDFTKSKDILLNVNYNAIETIHLVRKMVVLEEQKLVLVYHNLQEMIEESYMILKPMMDGKSIALKINVDSDTQVYVERISFINSVLNNILTNAIKFSYPNSTIEIYTKPIPLNLIEVYIKDFGVGISNNMIINMFDIKRHTSQKGTKKEKGLGFGLQLVKKFIDLYAGKIEIRSKEETKYPKSHGTEIILTLDSKN
ncbi:MAG: hybrid sensor histidine kinase/response regulator [Leptospiraceae bacterium]|nr:hybrid sensor histidine kinase/response regulator [Leptospiraceae bacterium]MCP5497785.1 hybrid sensor histidine kinase/response regulator [Leptospiraceae bacterium]